MASLYSPGEKPTSHTPKKSGEAEYPTIKKVALSSDLSVNTIYFSLSPEFSGAVFCLPSRGSSQLADIHV
jgi:hypothetical protein